MYKEIVFMIFKCKRFVYSSCICIVLIGFLVWKITLESYEFNISNVCDWGFIIKVC